MIIQLSGIVIERTAQTLCLDVHGVGYEIYVPCRSVFPSMGEKACVLTHLIIREHEHMIFGFSHIQERALFQKLLKVSGVGPKMALAILSHMDPDTFAQALTQSHALTGIPGVGKKTAQRLQLELQGLVCSSPSPDQELIEGLTALGYSAQSSHAVAQKVIKQYPQDSLEVWMRAALRVLAG